MVLHGFTLSPAHGFKLLVLADAVLAIAIVDIVLAATHIVVVVA
jgi:hypothetical protein